MGAQFTIPLQQVIPGQLIASALWNGEFNNISTNFIPAGMDSYSNTDSQMQLQTNPFPGSVTSHATSLGGELERMRFVIAGITGNPYWYNVPVKTIAGIATTYLELAGGVMSGIIDMGNNRIMNVAPARQTGDVLVEAPGVIDGSASNAGGEREIAQGTISTPDLRDLAVSAAKLGDILLPSFSGLGGGNGAPIFANVDGATLNVSVTNKLIIEPGGVDTTQLADNSVTSAKIAANSVANQATSKVGSFPTTNFAAAHQDTGASVSLTTLGGSVLIIVNGTCNMTQVAGNGFMVFRDSTIIFSQVSTDGTTINTQVVDTPSAGAHTYKVTTANNVTNVIPYMQLSAYEFRK